MHIISPVTLVLNGTDWAGSSDVDRTRDANDHYKPTMPEASLNQRLIVAAQGASSWCHVCGQPAKCSIKYHNANRRHADYKPRTLKASPCSCRSHPCRPSAACFPPLQGRGLRC